MLRWIGGEGMDKAMMQALREDQAKLEAMTGESHPLEFIDEPPWDCTGCAGGDKWPVNQEVWRCPVCDTEYHDHG